MQLLAPLWLLTTLAVVIPLIYHLRRNTPPEVIRVGSTANLASGAALANRRTPRDLLLLFVRCLLLVLVAVALAGPVINTTPLGRRVVVVPNGDWEVVDSLTRSGATVITSASRFPWSAAKAAEANTTPGDTLLVIAPDDATRWIGPRPALARVSMAIAAPGDDSTQPGPPVDHVIGRTATAGATTPRHRAAATLWWAMVALAIVERALARRSADAG